MKTLELRPLITVFITLAVLTGAAYPLAVTGIGQALFPAQAHGSLVKDAQGTVVGSDLLAQKFNSPRYFQPRPSAADFATVASGASNLSPVSKAQADARAEREQAWLARGGTQPVPEALLTASGSGLDPHLPLAAVLYQASRVAQARGMESAHLKALIAETAEKPTFGFMGEERVNVLRLNRKLDSDTRKP